MIRRRNIIGKKKVSTGIDYYVAVSLTGSPGITVYDCSVDYNNPLSWTKLTPAVSSNIGDGLNTSPDGDLLVNGHGVSPFMTMYSMPGLTKLANPSVLPSGNVEWVAISNEHIAIIDAGADSILKIYRRSDMTLLTGTPEVRGTTYAMEFYDNGTKLAVGGKSGSSANDDFISLWNVSDWSMIHEFTTTGSIRGLDVSDDNSMIAVANARGIFVYSLVDYSQIRRLGASTWHFATAFSPDGQYLAIAEYQNNPSVNVYRTIDWSEITAARLTIYGTSYIDWSPDSRYLAVGKDYDLWVIDSTDWSKYEVDGLLDGDCLGAKFGARKA